MDICIKCSKENEPKDSVLGDELMLEKSEGEKIHTIMKWKIYCKDCVKKHNIKKK